MGTLWSPEQPACPIWAAWDVEPDLQLWLCRDTGHPEVLCEVCQPYTGALCTRRSLRRQQALLLRTIGCALLAPLAAGEAYTRFTCRHPCVETSKCVSPALTTIGNPRVCRGALAAASGVRVSHRSCQADGCCIWLERDLNWQLMSSDFLRIRKLSKYQQ